MEMNIGVLGGGKVKLVRGKRTEKGGGGILTPTPVVVLCFSPDGVLLLGFFVVIAGKAWRRW